MCGDGSTFWFQQTMKLFNLFLCSLNSVSAATPTNGQMLAGFGTEKKDELNKWFIENDGVMGGLSKGHYTIDNENQMMTFNGTISLEQNGGFSLVSGTKNYGEKMNLGAFKGIRGRVKSDGRKYQLELRTNARFALQPIQFFSFFEATKDEWSEFYVPFSDLEPAFHGNPMPQYKFDPAKVENIGFMLDEVLYDKVPGEFELLVDWIYAV